MKPKILFFTIFLLISVIFLSSYHDTSAYPDEEVQISVTTDKATYKPGEILTIKGAGAHSYSIWAKIISPQGDELTELKFLAPGSGEFSTAWIIPKSIAQGIYTVEVRDIIQKTTTNFQIQSTTEPAQRLHDPRTNPDTNFTAATFADTYRDIFLQVKGKQVEILIKAEGEPVSEEPLNRAKEIRFMQTYILKFLKYAKATNTRSDLWDNQLTTQVHSVWIEPLEGRSDVISITEIDSGTPKWVENLTLWWENGLISNLEYQNAIEYLQKTEIIPD
jgi:hypothetical protein